MARPVFFRMLASWEGVVAYDKKTIAELEEIATNLHAQIALHPDYKLSRLQLKECERWIELRRARADVTLTALF